jgi:RNase P subunit RPR2
MISPNFTTTLTKQDLAKIARWFNTQIKQKTCPCCDESAVIIWPYLSCLPLIGRSGQNGQRFAVVAECRTCGYLRNFSAEKVGLATRVAPTTHQAAKHIH